MKPSDCTRIGVEQFGSYRQIGQKILLTLGITLYIRDSKFLVDRNDCWWHIELNRIVTNENANPSTHPSSRTAVGSSSSLKLFLHFPCVSCELKLPFVPKTHSCRFGLKPTDRPLRVAPQFVYGYEVETLGDCYRVELVKFVASANSFHVAKPTKKRQDLVNELKQVLTTRADSLSIRSVQSAIEHGSGGGSPRRHKSTVMSDFLVNARKNLKAPRSKSCAHRTREAEPSPPPPPRRQPFRLPNPPPTPVAKMRVFPPANERKRATRPAPNISCISTRPSEEHIEPHSRFVTALSTEEAVEIIMPASRLFRNTPPPPEHSHFALSRRNI